MRIFIAGATGFIGRGVVYALRADGHELFALSRDAARARESLGERVTAVQGNPSEPGDWMGAVNRCDAVINLAGEQVVGRRWNEAVEREIRSSRVHGTKNIVTAIREAEHRPKMLINASAVGYYGNSREPALAETAEAGKDALARLCVEWEEAAAGAERSNVRVVRLRLGIAIHRTGGALKQMLPFFRLGLGGPIGSGRQGFPWIHRDDIAGIVRHVLATPDLSGPINTVAPDLVSNKEFARTLGRVLRRPALFPVPAFVLRAMYGKGADPMFTGQRPTPRRILGTGYKFKYHRLRDALEAEAGKGALG